MNIEQLKKENEQLQAQVQYLQGKLGETTYKTHVTASEIEFMQYISGHAVMPAYKVVAYHFGWKSTTSVLHKLKQLQKKGMMIKKIRGWVLTQAGKDIIEKGQNLN